MTNSVDLISQLEELFHPRSVAIVGLPRGMKTGKLFLISLLDQGFPGPIYPVHPTAEEIDGLKAYPSVSAIPETVDLAIILVPHHQALPIVRECADKGGQGSGAFHGRVQGNRHRGRQGPGSRTGPNSPGCRDEAVRSELHGTLLS